MSDRYNYMGVDIGTSGCKAVVFSPEGKQLASASREYDVIHTPDGGAELDAPQVLDSCLAVIGESARAAGNVRGLGISSQGEAFAAVGAKGEVLCNAMVSSDARAKKQAHEWPEHFGAEKLYQITGHTAQPLFSLFKLLWLRENRPQVWKSAHKFLCFEDMLQWRLGLDPAIGWPLAGRTMLFDVRKHAWSPEILGDIGLSSERLARPLASGSVAGTIPAAMARQLGLADGAFVVTGGHDQVCGALGAGVVQGGLGVYSIGTVECITPAFDRPTFAPELQRSNLCMYDHAAAGLYATVAFSITGGNLFKWFRDQFGAAEVAAAAQQGKSPYALLIEQMPQEPTDLLVLPYFTPSGTPYFDAEVRGAILGLRLSHSRQQILRALLEGVTLEMRLNLDILRRCGCRIDLLRATGGGAKSPRWLQLKADVLNTPIAVPAVTEAGCMGMAMAACAADGGGNLAELASRWVKITQTYHPDARRAQHYERVFANYRQLYPAIKALPFS